ncbi:bifunctional NUDIX hydrolase/phosphatase PAP2 family protein [Vibrio tapetis]|uniref:Membrane-associated phospholipid phosphatase n=1 Tax=Vibrio tapetis subsp. tapetis TaxID=1671868 RepID=A0A2N8ZA54_9VIBR|nr:NUDIX domain-containing protein [Vibrio tapetis]SON48753.1 Membrane-associated phospholipid phosphatase [Vibrio tapetis subsp. tapetis]
MLLRCISTVLLSFVFGLYSQLALADSPAELKGALCLIKSDQEQIVLVRETITNKLSLPGGTIESGEEPSLAAQRETWEETGLVVTVGKQLGYSGKAVVFDCVSDSDVIAFHYVNDQHQHIMPAWFAPHYGIEVNQVLLAYLEGIQPADYRFPAQVADILKLASRATEHNITFIEQASQAAPTIHQSELPYIQSLQQNIANLPDQIRTVLHQFFLVADAIASPVLLILALVFAYLHYGRNFAAKLVFAVTCVSLLGLVAQIGLALPRPFVYIPELQLAQHFGFGMPSVSSALMVSVLGMLYIQLEKVSGEHAARRYLSVMFTLPVLQGFAAIYLGSSFFSDVIAGFVLGGLIVWHFDRLERKIGSKLDDILTGAPLWWIAVLVVTALGLVWPRPEFSYWLSIVISLAAVFTFLRPRREYLNLSNRQVIVGMSVIFLINMLFSMLSPQFDSSSMSSLILQATHYAVLILAFAIGVVVFEKKSQTTID